MKRVVLVCIISLMAGVAWGGEIRPHADGRWSNLDSICFDINTGKKVECGAWPSKPKPKPCRWEHKQVIGDNLINALNDGWELVDSDFNRELRTVFDAWSGISRYINRPVMVPYGIVRKQVCE